MTITFSWLLILLGSQEIDLSRESKKVKPEMGVENVEKSDPACIVYTSGTTGESSDRVAN